MRTGRAAAWALWVGAVAAGTLADRAPDRPTLRLGGWRVLSGDFHVHPFPLSGGVLAPWDLALEARHQGLDVIAVTPHNSLIGSWWAAPFAGSSRGPIVIGGEEIRGPEYHLIAAGIHERISWRLSAAAAIDAAHRQGGVTIAAHPTRLSWAAYDLATERKLDGAEVLHPAVFTGQAAELREFYERAPVAAIGSSDYHGYGPLGLFRTYVFAADASAAAVLEAIRARRTVVIDGDRAFGDPALLGYASQLPPAPPRAAWWQGALAVAGLAALVLTGGR